MAERNKHIPFPELVSNGSSLEKLVVGMAHERFTPYAQLPKVISATTIETYVNWISDLTTQDPNLAERGSLLHVQADNDRILYDDDPYVGSYTETYVRLPKERDKFIPTLPIHSHRVDVGPSPATGDMMTLLHGNGKWAPPGMLVATPGHNYLVIKSEETPPIADSEEVHKKARGPFYREDLEDFLRFGTRVARALNSGPGLEMAYLRANDLFGMSVSSYYANFIQAITLSEAYKLGFYRSNKDGRYVHFTPSMVMWQVTRQVNDLLSRSV